MRQCAPPPRPSPARLRGSPLAHDLGKRSPHATQQQHATAASDANTRHKVTRTPETRDRTHTATVQEQGQKTNMVQTPLAGEDLMHVCFVLGFIGFVDLCRLCLLFVDFRCFLPISADLVDLMNRGAGGCQLWGSGPRPCRLAPEARALGHSCKPP